MKTPDKIFVPVVYLGPEEGYCPSPIWWKKDKSHEHEEVIGSIIYIRKDLVDEKPKTAEETIQLAEDHAYFAGKEKLREGLLEWVKEKMLEYEALSDNDAVRWGQRNALKQVIDKLNSM